MNPSRVLKEIKHIYQKFGNEAYASVLEEPITQRSHAAQAAYHMKKRTSYKPLIVAAYLHDIGHFIQFSNIRNSVAQPASIDTNDYHERHGALWLMSKGFPLDTIMPVLMHADAKRYLASKSEDYYQHLSEASKKTMVLQGGVMSKEELRTFENHPYFEEAVELRHCDDAAKEVDFEKENAKDIQEFDIDDFILEVLQPNLKLDSLIYERRLQKQFSKKFNKKNEF